MSFKPAIVAKTQSIKLKITFSKALMKCPSVQSCIVSFEKVENVLNPPQNPVTNNNR